MFLNNLGKPIKVPNTMHSSVEQQLDCVPIFLCSAESLNHPLSNSWSGCIYSSKRILDDINKNLNFPSYDTDANSLILHENVSITVQINKNSVSVTMIPVFPGSTDNVMFLIDNGYVKLLYTENLNDTLDAVMYNKTLREAIQDQIDILYIDDSVFMKVADIASARHPTEFQLRAWTCAIRPKIIVGMHKSYLPKHILENCMEVDIHSDKF